MSWISTFHYTRRFTFALSLRTNVKLLSILNSLQNLMYNVHSFDRQCFWW